MRLFNHHFLRIFVALLVTVFITNTVYAGSMMVSASFNTVAVKTSAQSQVVSEHAVEHHCDDHGSSGQHYSYQPHDQSPSHGGCGHCNHCLACYSIILHDQLNVAPISSKHVLAIATNVLYLAPANPQPNKPPIS